jgi:hypothetical protein
MHDFHGHPVLRARQGILPFLQAACILQHGIALYLVRVETKKA